MVLRYEATAVQRGQSGSNLVIVIGICKKCVKRVNDV
jgi:hypothetical protein